MAGLFRQDQDGRKHFGQSLGIRFCIGLRYYESGKQGKRNDYKGHGRAFLLWNGQKYSVAEAEKPPLRVEAKPKETRRS